MKKGEIPFYPLIVAAFPVVSVYSANLAYVPLGHLWRPLLATVAAAAVLTVLLGLALRNAARGAAATTALILLFFGYGWFNTVVDKSNLFLFGADPMIIWGVLTVAIVALAAWRIKEVKALNVLASFIALIAVANVGLRLAQAKGLGARGPREALKASTTGTRPDVVYVILDGYGRSDAVKRAIGFDNSSFIAGLKKRGFYVADRSHSNYCQTELSLSSSLNMDTVQNLLPNVKKDTEERKPLAELVDDNEVARRFRAKGYQFVAITSGFPPISFEHADLQMHDASGGTMVESALLRMTPFAATNVALSQFTVRRSNLLSALDNLGSIGQPTAAPRLVIAHILAPHPPFVFGPNGEAVQHKGVFGFFDGSDYMTFVSNQAQYRHDWAGQAEFLDKKVLEALDRILAGPGAKPLIVIQGDHGSKVGLDQNDLQKTDLHECFPILNAYLVPDAVKKDLRNDITPINTFRTILRDLFGDDLPPLQDRSWYSRYATPYDFTEVTDRIEPIPAPALSFAN